MAKITQQMPKVRQRINLSYITLNTFFGINFVTYDCRVFCMQVHIEFTEGEDRITLEGPTKDVQMVQSQIEAIVTDLVSIELTIHRFLDLDWRPANQKSSFLLSCTGN